MTEQRRDMTPDAMSRVRLSDEARTLFCERMEVSDADADALFAEVSKDLAQRYDAWKKQHPKGTLLDFAQTELASTLSEITGGAL